jgi:hypothetical protein
VAITQLKAELDAVAKEETVLKSNRIEVRLLLYRTLSNFF